jgi:hypothetical protein
MIAVEISHYLVEISAPNQLLSLPFYNTEEKRPTRGCVSHECNERAIYDGAGRAAVASSAGPFALSVKLLRLTEKSQFLGSISCR